MNNNFFGVQSPSEEELQHRRASQHGLGPGQPDLQGPIAMAPPTSTSAFPSTAMTALVDTPMMGVDSLDDIIHQNSHELHRRRSVPPHASYPVQVPPGPGDRRMSMMEFGHAAPPESFKDFQFTGIDTSQPEAMVSGGFSDMNGGVSMAPHSAAYSQPAMLSGAVAPAYSTLSPPMLGDMMEFSELDLGQLAQDQSSMSLYNAQTLAGPFSSAGMEPASSNYAIGLDADNVPLNATSTKASESLGMDAEDTEMTAATQGFGPHEMGPPHQQPQRNMSVGPYPPTVSATALSSLREDNSPPAFQPGMPTQQGHSPAGLGISHPPTAPATPVGLAATPPTAPPHTLGPPRPNEKFVYSKSGFDMIRALYYVAARPNPQIHLGAVDMSCAFVVCDVTQNDCPIIYVSDNFQNLTGYSKYEIMGRNCRFLQAPDGLVEAGTRREFVENEAVYNLKNKIAEGKEVQQSLINYRKGGKPFLNLLTMIPIPWDVGDDTIRYFVGFQIDLVECPEAISGQEPGPLQINYMGHNEIQYIWTPPASSHWEPESGQTLGVDDVSALLKSYAPGKGPISDWHRQSWDKMLLENTDDVVHVLSLKGLFLYLSPSCKKVLGYDNSELLGQSLSSVCHPSDIVPVTRELKDTQADRPVNIVFRIRCKNSGYTWFESHGSLHLEPGKGRKCIILIGRKRPVLALQRRDLEANGGIGDSEIWTKLSTSGLFLFVSSNVRSLLDLQPEDLVGTSIQDLMRKETRAEFGRSIEKARRGRLVACKHEVQNRRGQVLQAQTVLYPGDAEAGQKPTFLLAQTRLLKASSRSGSGPSAASTAAKNTPSASGAVDEAAAAAVAAGSVLGVPGGVTPSGGRIAEGPGPGPVGSMVVAGSLQLGQQDAALASDDNIFEELKTTRATSWQYELRQMEKVNRLLAEQLGQLLTNKKKRKRRKGVGSAVRDCANCHTRNTPEWRRGPSGQRDLCNSCGLRWAKQTGRVSPRNSSRGDAQSKKSSSPVPSPPRQRDVPGDGGGGDGGDGNKTAAPAAAMDVLLPETARGGASEGGEGEGGGQAATGSFKSFSGPPPSQPLLAGRSGSRGGGMAMSAIREEREASS